jgi:SAM-dependent methyltransferase
MFTVEWNRALFETYHWPGGGDEWSGAWGGVAMQWQRTILPRVQSYLPAGTVLEIAPGFGRWTDRLKDLCRRLIVVDVSAKCIEACRRRFHDCEHVECHVNDGTSLEMVEDEAVDFAFSFDSLVHVNREVLRAYLRGLACKLSPDGVAFLHHSNLGEYARRDALLKWLPLGSRLRQWLGGYTHYRAPDVSAEGLAQDAEESGLACISQELVNWASRRQIDCFSVLTRRSSRWARPRRAFRNRRFNEEILEAARLAQLHAAP